jgi:predicted nucleic acid-binding protein
VFLEEPERDALESVLRRWEVRASSVLLRVEALRTCARYGPDRLADARLGLIGMVMIDVDDSVIDEAAALRPLALRSLGAIHLATALSLGRDLGVLITYDGRLAEAAEASGVRVLSPR